METLPLHLQQVTACPSRFPPHKTSKQMTLLLRFYPVLQNIQDLCDEILIYNVCSRIEAGGDKIHKHRAGPQPRKTKKQKSSPHICKQARHGPGWVGRAKKPNNHMQTAYACTKLDSCAELGLVVVTNLRHYHPETIRESCVLASTHATAPLEASSSSSNTD